jgi:uncharacterized protein YdaU (DUF1376 family)
MPKDDRPPAMMLYFDDFVSDGKVEAMTTQQVGAYFLLLAKAWREDPPGSIPNDDRVLARWARLTPDDWSECRAGVLAAFTLGTDDRWHQKRMRKEFAKLIERAKQKSLAAKRAADARWMQTHCDRIADAHPPDIPNDAISSSSSFSNSSNKPSSSSLLDSARIPPSDGGDGGFCVSWEEIQTRLARVGITDSRGAIKQAKLHGLSEKHVSEVIDYFEAHPKKWTNGGLHWRISNGLPNQSSSEGWPPSRNGNPVSEAKKSKQALNDRAMTIIRDGRRNKLPDDVIEAKLASEGLKW